MALINAPGDTAVDVQDAKGRLQRVEGGWRNFFSQVFLICNALTMSGTTARRPTVVLWVGRTYFDVSLGIPIWLQALGPPNVWVNSAGAPV